MAYKLGENGKVINSKTGKIARQPIVWAKKAIGGAEERKDFSAFMLVKGASADKQVEHSKIIAAMPTDRDAIASVLISGKITLHEAQDILVEAACLPGLRDRREYELLESRKITSAKSLKLLADDRWNSTDYVKKIIENRLIPDSMAPDGFYGCFGIDEVGKLKSDHPEFAKNWLLKHPRLVQLKDIPKAIMLMDELEVLGDFKHDESRGSSGWSLGAGNHEHVRHEILLDGSPINSLRSFIVDIDRMHKGEARHGIEKEVLGALAKYPELASFAKLAFSGLMNFDGEVSILYTHKAISEDTTLQRTFARMGFDLKNLDPAEKGSLGF
ncbi:MAG: hypothetical protein WC861_06360 [Candidatus Micrarchaeia archaeon]